MRTPGTCFLTISPPLLLAKKVRIPRCRLCFSRCFPLCSSCKHLPMLPQLCKTSFMNTQTLTAPPTMGDAGWAGAKSLGLYGMLPSPPSAVLSSLLHPQSVISPSSESPYLYVSRDGISALNITPVLPPPLGYMHSAEVMTCFQASCWALSPLVPLTTL